ncbi:MAG: UvrB/UvrC motif-containing protein [Tissierellia bacterium]|nr:UvrB/UvrC motif-containing protein [Tissierellia bacterium]
MKCDKCGKEANVKIKAIINGHSSDMYLCGECFEKYINKEDFADIIDLSEELKDGSRSFEESSLIDSFLPTLSQVISGIYDYNYSKNNDVSLSIREKLSNNVCPNCGNEESNIEQGLFDCEKCYSLNRNLTTRVLKRFNNYKTYSGKMPRRFKKFQNIADKIKKLQEQLTESIEIEDYERASSLRDEINKLNGMVRID